MNKIKITKTWKIVAAIFIAVVLLGTIFSLVVTPKINKWVIDQIPGGSQVRTALGYQFPKNKIGISARTSNSPDGQQRILVVSIVGKESVSNNQLMSAKTTLCNALGRNAQQYSAIYLQSISKQQFLFFYYSKGMAPVQVNCN